MAGLRLRAATAEDAEVVAGMAAALSRHEGVPPPNFTAETFRRDGFGPDAAFATILAELDGRPVGYAISYPAYDVQSGSRGRHVADLYVEPEARGRGVGKALLAMVARVAKAHGARWLVLQMMRSNSNAEAFYRHLGGRQDEAAIFVFQSAAFEALAG